MLRKFSLIGLLLLLGCSSTPIGVVGSFSLVNSATSSNYNVDRKLYSYVYFCPKKINIEERARSARIPVVIEFTMKQIAEKECFKADVNIDDLTFSIENLPTGRYTIGAVFVVETDFNSKMQRFMWFKDVDIKKVQQLNPLSVDNAIYY